MLVTRQDLLDNCFMRETTCLILHKFAGDSSVSPDFIFVLFNCLFNETINLFKLKKLI